MRTYLVTGGAGFIGSSDIHYMFRKYGDSIRIINVDALTYAGNLENLKDVENQDNYTFVRADIRDREAIEKIFEENDIDRVVHFAAESHVDRSIRNPEIFVETNVLGTLVMLNAAKKAWELPDGTYKEDKRFLYVSTDEVPEDYKEHEKEILMAQAKNDPKNANKPENIIEKMISGRLNKELKEVCLLEQEYVKAENKETVAKYLEMVSKEVGSTVALKRFIRFETGEGLEKKNEDFAAEVAAQMNA